MYRRALLTGLGVALPVGLAGCSQFRAGRTNDGAEEPLSERSNATVEERPATAPEAVTLLEHELVRDGAGTADELVRIVGAVRNDGDALLEGLIVTARFRDADAETLETASADLLTLGPGEQWQFSLVYPGNGRDARTVADYRLRVTTDGRRPRARRSRLSVLRADER